MLNEFNLKGYQRQGQQGYQQQQYRPPMGHHAPMGRGMMPGGMHMARY